MAKREKVGAVIAAAGLSQRMGGVDKLFTLLGGKPIITLVINTFQKCPAIDQIVVVLSQPNLKQGEQLAAEQKWSKVTDICPGGERRQDSVIAGLNRLKDCSWVVIHDGARPFVTPALVQRLFKGLKGADCCIPVLPVRYTIKEIEHQGKARTLNRTHLYEVQTPQLFKTEALLRAYRYVMKRRINVERIYDDAQLVEYIHGKVQSVPGDALNIKITYPEDIVLAGNIAGRYNKK